MTFDEWWRKHDTLRRPPPDGFTLDVWNAAVAAEREASAKRAMALMERLNTDYRHEIADAIRSGVNP
jgi:hypothetical protein